MEIVSFVTRWRASHNKSIYVGNKQARIYPKAVLSQPEREETAHAKSVAAATTRETMQRKAKVTGNAETFNFSWRIYSERWRRKTMIAKHLGNNDGICMVRTEVINIYS